MLFVREQGDCIKRDKTPKVFSLFTCPTSFITHGEIAPRRSRENIPTKGWCVAGEREAFALRIGYYSMFVLLSRRSLDTGFFLYPPPPRSEVVVPAASTGNSSACSTNLHRTHQEIVLHSKECIAHLLHHIHNVFCILLRHELPELHLGSRLYPHAQQHRPNTQYVGVGVVITCS